MTTRLLALGLVAALMAASLLPAHAQFADETQGLFKGDPDAPATKDDLLIFDLDSDGDTYGSSGSAKALSVEELCCQMTAEERAVDGLCYDVQCAEQE